MVTNLNTGKADYMEVPRLDRNSQLLQATCAMPLMFPIYHLNSQPYLDGGIADPIPWRRAMDRGCDRVMVVMTHPRDYVRKQERLMPLIRKTYREYPNFVAAMESRAQRYNEDRERIFELERQGKPK